MMFKKYLKYKTKYLNYKKGGNIDSTENDIKALILPHAGIDYVKCIMDYVFYDNNDNNENNEEKLKVKKEYTNIILLTTNHRSNNNVQFENQLYGITKFDYNIMTFDDSFFGETYDGKKEHSHLSILPYLEKFRCKKYIICIGKYDEGLIAKILEMINKSKTLIIANTDLLHCGDNFKTKCPLNTKIYNKNMIEQIINNNIPDQICGKEAIHTFLKIVEKLGYKYVEYVQSSSNMIDKSSSNDVGYCGLIYNKSGNVLLNNGNYLSKIPRMILNEKFDWDNNTIKSISKFRERIPIELYLKDIIGIFVTVYLKIDDKLELKGCLGTYTLHNDIFDTIIIQTIESTFDDSRFTNDHITKENLNNCVFKINFLEKSVKYSGDKLIENVLKNLIVNTHGIIVDFKSSRATYLASVLSEHFGMNDSNKNEKIYDAIKSLRLKSGLANNTNIDDVSDVVSIELYKCVEISEI